MTPYGMLRVQKQGSPRMGSRRVGVKSYISHRHWGRQGNTGKGSPWRTGSSLVRRVKIIVSKDGQDLKIYLSSISHTKNPE